MPIRSPLAAVLLLAAATQAVASSDVTVVETRTGEARIAQVVDGLDQPWGLAFLPDGRFLVTERDGRMTLFPAGGGEPIARFGKFEGLVARGQGGLLDVLVPRDFATTGEILYSFSMSQPGGGSGTALAAARLSPDGTRLEDRRVLFQMRPGSDGGRHFGSRIAEADDGTLFLSIGDRGAGTPSQDMSRHEGAIVHLNRDGTAASPGLFGPEALPDLYSKGHRNPQGAAFDEQGRLWVVEHGAAGGDELNLVRAGANYGWPTISYGVDYDGSQIGIGTEAPGMEQPVHFWDPSIAPSGLMIYSGAMFPEWRGDVFTGSLKFDYISRLDPEAGFAEERIEAPQTGRVRDIRQAPDGSIWFLSVNDGAVYRLFRS